MQPCSGADDKLRFWALSATGLEGPRLCFTRNWEKVDSMPSCATLSYACLWLCTVLPDLDRSSAGKADCAHAAHRVQELPESQEM